MDLDGWVVGNQQTFHHYDFLLRYSCGYFERVLGEQQQQQQQQQRKRRWCGFQTWTPETGPVWWPFWNPTRSEPHRLNPKSPKTMSICCCRGFTNSNCTRCFKSVTWSTPRLSKTTSSTTTSTTLCTTNRHTETTAQHLETVAIAVPWIPQVP